MHHMVLSLIFKEHKNETIRNEEMKMQNMKII